MQYPMGARRISSQLSVPAGQIIFMGKVKRYGIFLNRSGRLMV
jgi:hypothetical protein